MTSRNSKTNKSAKSNSRTMLLTCVTAAAAIGYVYMVFIPGQKSISRLRAEQRNKQDVIAANATVTLEIENTKTALENARAIKTQLSANTPTVDQVATVFASISQQAKAAGTSIVRFDPQTPARMASISQVPVGLTVEGSYAQIFDLLGRLDQASTPVWEKEVLIQASRDKQGVMQCQVNLTIFADNRENSN